MAKKKKNKKKTRKAASPGWAEKKVTSKDNQSIKEKENSSENGMPPSRVRDEKGRFVKGDCGGPGRPSGSANKILRKARGAVEQILPLVLDAALQGDKDAWGMILRHGMPKAKGFVDDPDGVSDETRQILELCLSGEISLKEAALRFDLNGIPLPEGFKVLLSKQEPEAESTDNGAFRAASNDVIEQRRMAAAQEEDAEEWLINRRKEMNQLHREMSDSYAPGAMPESGERDEEGGKSEEREDEKK